MILPVFLALSFCSAFSGLVAHVPVAGAGVYLAVSATDKQTAEISITSPQEDSVFNLPLPDHSIALEGKINGLIQPDQKLEVGIYGGDQDNFRQHWMYSFPYPVNPDGSFQIRFPIGRLVHFPKATPDHYTFLFQYPNAPEKTLTVIIK